MSDDEPDDVLADTMNKSSDDASVASVATALAGKGLLQEHKLSGTYRKQQLRYDLRLFVQPS